MTCKHFASLALVLLIAPAADATAQTENRLAIGGEFQVKTSDRASKEDYAQGQFGLGLLWRMGEEKGGWGFHWGLNWYEVTIERPIGGTATALGELHIRPIMAGYGYTYLIRHYSITADVLGGYAIGSIGLEPPAIDAYRRALGVETASSSASNTFVLKPEIGLWYDLNKKVGINVNAGYMMARPDVSIVTSAGTDFRTVRADQFILKAGIVYAILGSR